MKNKNHNDNVSHSFLKSLLVAGGILVLSACGGGSGSDISSYQDDDSPPVASATAIGLGESVSASNNTFRARSNTEVVLSGKDSDSNVSPILEFNWEQTGGPTVTLVERTANSVAFDAPNDGTDTTLTFRLSIVDGNENTDTDEVTIEIISASDPGRFLADPRVPESKLTLLAALDGGQDTGANSQPFTIEVQTIAHWRNRLGEMDELVVNTQIIDDLFPANFNPSIGYDPLTEPRNPRLELDVISLDADSINQNFETTDRDRRLDAFEIPTAYLEIQITITSAPALNFDVFALNNSGDSTVDGNDIEGSSTSGSQTVDAINKAIAGQKISTIDVDKIDGSVEATAASNGALLQTSTGLMTSSLLTTNVLNELGLESHITANAYYNLIDPAGETTTFSAWAKLAGFLDDDGNEIEDPSIAHALYVNNYDLGFGRDMFLRKADNGNVYSYVTNYPSLESGIEKRGEFAIVAMEYSENPDPAGVNAKIVKFFVFSYDERSGDFVRVNSLNFDGTGEKFVPGVCTVCHQSYPGTRDYSDVSQADLGATFFPWDLDSLLYSHAANPQEIEPTLNTALIPQNIIDQYSRENQEAEFRKLNLGALATYVDDPARYAASIELVHGWYGDPDQLLPIDELPDLPFDGSFVPAGWAGQEELYRDVFSRTCRICHTQIGDEEKNFNTYDEFIDKKDIIIDYVYQQGLMPIARLSFDRFWVNYNGGESAADALRTHLEGLGDTVPLAPGLPVPLFAFDPETGTIGNTISVNASASVFSESYSWSLTAPSGSSTTLNNTTGLISSFTPDTPAGTYEVTLTTTNASGITADYTDSFTVDNRTPAAECITANTTSITPAGLLANIPIVSQLTELGDGGVTISSATNGTLGTVTLNPDGETVDYQLNDPFNRGVDTFEYQVSDFDGTLSTTGNNCFPSVDGFAIVTIDSSITGTGAPASATATVDAVNNTTEIDINWTAPPGITPDGYNVYRNATATGSPINSSLITGTSFSDNNDGSGLTANTTYDYSVTSVINGFESQPTTTSASTVSLTPTALVASNGGSTTADETQIALSWSVPGAGSGTVQSYTIYRDSVLADTSLTNSYTDTGLTPGTTYSYEVSANDGLQESPLSNTSTQSTRPVGPTSLNLVAGTNATTDITLSWTAPASGNFDVYGVYRDSAEIARVGTTSFADNGLSANTNYSYFVTAISDNGGSLEKESAQSNTDNLTTAPAGAAEATNLTATIDGTLDATEVDLTWVAPTAFTPEGYNIYRSVNNGAYTLLGTQPTVGAVLAYTDSGLSNDTQYEYQIAGILGGVEQARTAETLLATATTLSLQPTSLSAGAVSNASIAFSWVSPAATEDANFQIARSSDGGASFPTDLGTATCCADTDNTVTAGTSYVYRVTASQGADSAENTITIASSPNDPTAMSATTISTAQINLSWSAPAGNVDSYSVYRDDDGYTTPILTGIAGLSSSDVGAVRGIASGTDYAYRVVAVTNGVESTGFAASSATTTPSAPTLNSATTVSTSQINLSWSAVSGDIDSYNVYRNGGGIPVATGIVGTSYPDTGRASGTSYSYTVRAVANGEISSDSNSVNGATVPATPTTITASSASTTNGADAIRVSSYTISCSGDTPTYTITSSGTGAPGAVVTTLTTRDVTGYNSNTSYSITVSAECNGVNSATSSAALATTELSYNDQILSGVVARVGCNDALCHAAATRGRLALINSTYTCIETDLNTCSASMVGLPTLTAGEVTLIKDWIADGEND